MADPTPSTFLQALRVLCASLMSALIVLLVAVSVVLAGKKDTGSTPIWAFAVLAVVAAADVVLIPLVGYRFKPVAPGTPEDDARRSSVQQVQQTTILRFALSEAVATIGLALAFVVDRDGFVLVFAGVVVAEVLMFVHVWPGERLISKAQAALESEGGLSYLREALNSPPPSRRA